MSNPTQNFIDESQKIQLPKTPSDVGNIFIHLFNALIHYFLSFSFIFPYIIILVISSFILLITLPLIKQILLFFRQLKQESIILEIKPLRRTEQSALSTTQLFNQLHGQLDDPSFLSNFLLKPKKFSFEIISDRVNGIRYLIHTSLEDAAVVKKTLLSFLPGIQINEVEDYLPNSLSLNDKKLKVIELKQNRHFAYPLSKQTQLEENDPIAYVTGQMTKLLDSEFMSMQVIISAAGSDVEKEVENVRQIILEGKDIFSYLDRIRPPKFLSLLVTVAAHIIFIVLFTLSLIACLIGAPFSNGKSLGMLPSYSGFFNKKPREKRLLNVIQQEMESQIQDKTKRQLFQTSIRVLLALKNKEELNSRETGMRTFFSSFTNPGYQKLTFRFNNLNLNQLKMFQNFQLFRFKNRISIFSPSSILSVSELADIYHLPFTSTTKTEDLVKVRSKDLPTPLAVKNDESKFDVILGKNYFGGEEVTVGLTRANRTRHVYIVGGTEMGKSNLLSDLFYQDMDAGRGCAIVDPHGDVADKLIGMIPEHRKNDVYYFNPDDYDFPIGINIIEVTGKTEKERAQEKDFIIDCLVSLFKHLYPPQYSGPRMEYILRNATLTALEIIDSTIFTVHRLITNEKFRNQVVSNLKNPILRDFWLNEFSTAGDYQRAEWNSPITNKIGKFLTSSMTSAQLGQKKNKLNFDYLINNNKILICNLSKGKIGDEAAKVLGTLIVFQIQHAALRRARLDPEKRKDFYLYIDEFQNFATPSFEEILSESRKYRLYITLAHQTISQIEDHDLTKIIFANVGTIIAFRTANPLDEEYLLPIFRPEIEQGEILNLPPYQFYIKINSAQTADAFSVQTDQFNVPYSEKMAQFIINNTRKKYAVKREEVEKEILESFGGSTSGRTLDDYLGFLKDKLISIA